MMAYRSMKGGGYSWIGLKGKLKILISKCETNSNSKIQKKVHPGIHRRAIRGDFFRGNRRDYFFSRGAKSSCVLNSGYSWRNRPDNSGSSVNAA